MDRITETIKIISITEIPSIEKIQSIQREKVLKLIFEKTVQDQRELIGKKLKKQLHDFQVGIHLTEPEINIAKLITEKEIEDNQDFFEQCAKNYRKLSEELIFKFVKVSNKKALSGWWEEHN